LRDSGIKNEFLNSSFVRDHKTITFIRFSKSGEQEAGSREQEAGSRKREAGRKSNF
jgi:hypothetical protein